MMDDAWSWMGSWDDARKGRHRGTVPFAPAMSVALQRKSRPGFALERGGPWCRNECVPVEPTTSVATAAVSLDGVTSDPSIDLCRRVVVFAGTARARLALPHPADRCGCSHLTQIIRARVFFPIMAMVDA